jgi:quercetin dioxygenase-like cupin family protein
LQPTRAQPSELNAGIVGGRLNVRSLGCQDDEGREFHFRRVAVARASSLGSDVRVGESAKKGTYSMAVRILDNPATGERFIFTDEGTEPDGRIRRLTYEMQPGARVDAHRHPGHVQTFRVVSGQLHVEADGRSLVLGPGDTAECSRGGVHQQRNEGAGKVVVEEGYDPPLDIEPLFVVAARAAERGEVLSNGRLKNPLKLGIIVRDFRRIIAPANRWLNLAGHLLGAVGSLCGYRRWYEADLPRR